MAAGDSIDLTFPAPPNKGWLEVEWHSPGDSNGAMIRRRDGAVRR